MQNTHLLYQLRDAGMRLTLSRDCLQGDLFSALSQLLEELLHGTSDDSVIWCYHEFASRVFALDDYSVTGDRFRDYILAMAIESENPFAQSAAAGKKDEALFRAQIRELHYLQMFYEITDEKLTQNVQLKSKDDRNSWVRWSISHAPDFGKGPLSKMRKLFYEAEDWSMLAQPLWDFYHTHGVGALLQSNHFVLEDRLFPLPFVEKEAIDFESNWPDYLSISRNVKNAYEGGSAFHIAVLGDEGQRAIAKNLLGRNSMPGFRFIEIAQDAMFQWTGRVHGAMQELENLPGLNLFYVDLRGQDARPLGQIPPVFKKSIVFAALQNDETNAAIPGFKVYDMPVFSEDQFIGLVTKIAQQNGCIMQMEQVKSAPQLSHVRAFSIEEAHRLAKELMCISFTDSGKA